ncbi:hypothetical protein RB596_008906 [Gaeumannomyces avenae]
MDYAKLRDAALQHGEDEEAVTVDTRALIDKVLARYSGEWTTLRELIQNAADAQATTVKVKWETHPSTTVPLPQTTNQTELLKHVITNHTLRRLLVNNDGQPFTKTDWARLKRIAEGNPDETKIGAFGVGFYSVFADCEEPFISSGSEAMAFYWKGNALFTRKLVLPQDQSSSDTTFVLDYRNSTTALPNLLSVGQFLATSLTFVALQNIEFWIDDWMILKLQKKTSPSVDVPIPRDLEATTQERLMRIARVDRVSTQIDATTMRAIGWKPKVGTISKLTETYGLGSAEMGSSLRGFFSRLTSSSSQSTLKTKATKEEKVVPETTEDLTATTTSSIFLRVTSAAVATSVQASFAAELERATKKPPPKTTKLAILTSSYDENQATQSSRDTSTGSADVFASVLPTKKPGGKIFIGFPTAQTTGGGMHISAPSVIPTVEREAIDLNARWVRTWNMEMLRAAGIMTRLAFSVEMADLNEKFLRAVAAAGKGGKISAADVAKFTPEAIHILNTYSFKDSTPSSNVGQLIESSFWTAFKKASIEVFSSRGVLPSTKVRVGSDELGKFVNDIPIIIKEMEDQSFVRKLHDFGLIEDITVKDIRQELEAKALNRDQLANFLAWAGKTAVSGELDMRSRQALLDVAVATIGDSEDQGEIIALSSITSYLSANKIPANLPLPPTTLPYSLTVNIPQAHLQALGWRTLEIVPWLRFLIDAAGTKGDEQNITKSEKFAVQVLTVLSKNWDNLNPGDRTAVVSGLQDKTVMPTKVGMKRPAESFFTSVKLFDDLPTIQGCQAVKEKVLVALGVRKTLDLETIFTRLLSPQHEGAVRWSHMELIKYLASVRDDIPSDDMKRLKESRICPREAGPPGMEATKGSNQLFKVSELFEPNDSLRTLRLPILHWPGPPGSFRPSGVEARFLSSLGLRSCPSVPELVDMMASEDPTMRINARTYFIGNHHINNYASYNIAGTKKAILPIQGNEKLLVPPTECYVDNGAAILGFNVLEKSLQVHANKFGVARDPPITICVNKLIAKPPRDQAAAVTLFRYFATRLSDLHESSLAKLRDAPLVPVTRLVRGSGPKEMSRSTILMKPSNCYLGSSSTYSDIFDFVDFGSDANAFLFKCGAKSEPTKVEIARLACNEPARLLSILQSPEKYLNLLRTLADDQNALRKDRELWAKMKTSSFLLASKEIAAPRAPGADPDEDEAPIKQYQLAAPNQIVILDDYISYRLFKDSLVCAPEEDLLESFYLALGSQMLGSLVQEDLKIGPQSDKQDTAAILRKHVLERSKLFLYEWTKHNRDPLKHDVKWLEKNLSVQTVRSVALRRSLRGQGKSHLEKRSAASAPSQNGWVLYISAERDHPDMYQVGQAVCQLLLTRPGQQAYLSFEPFLKLNLLDLRARGYNVDRILRAKAAEARIAEEERRKALEEEQARIKEAAEEWQRRSNGSMAVAAGKQRAPTPPPTMPGAFGADSPEEHGKRSPPPNENRKSRGGFLSNWSKQLGFRKDEDDESQKQLQNFLPPPEPAKPSAGAGSSGGGAGTEQQSKGDDGRVTSPAVVQQNLLNAIKSTRAHDSSKLFSPPQTSEVKEQATYCDSNAAHDLKFVAEGPAGMRIFVANDLSVDASSFVVENRARIKAFESMLREIADVYGLSNKVLHIFYDERGGTIAFNSSGSIFCNLRFYAQLHAERVLASYAATRREAMMEAATWWWVVIAHELAHNIVQVHDAHHSYYTESFIQQFFPKMVAKSAALAAAADQAAGGGPAAAAARASLPPPPAHDSSVPPPYSRRAPAPTNLLD